MRKKPVKVYDVCSFDNDINSIEVAKEIAKENNMYFYSKHSIDIDEEEAKELARKNNQSKVFIYEDDSLPYLPVKTDDELKKMFDDNFTYINNNMGKITVGEFLKKYHKSIAENRFEKLRQLGTNHIPVIIIINERKMVQQWNTEKLPINNFEKYKNLIIDFYEIKTGKKGKKYIEMKLKDGRTLFEFKNRFRSLKMKDEL